jgi:hypothetical protein
MGVNLHIALDLVHKPTDTNDSGFIKAASTPTSAFSRAFLSRTSPKMKANFRNVSKTITNVSFAVFVGNKAS